MIRFDGRVAIVTGAGRGLGAAYGRELARRGAKVVVHDAGVGRRGEGGDPSVADGVVDEIHRDGGTAIASYENLESVEACIQIVERTVEELGRVDILINNAGLVIYEEIDEADRSWETLRRISIDAPFHLSRAVFPIMRLQRYGRIVFTTSGIAMSADVTRPGLAGYAAGKMAQFGLMVAFAAEGRPHGILTNAISPVAATRVYTQQYEPGELKPEQVAAGVIYLVSEDCAANGVVLSAAGGTFSLRWWERGEEVDLGEEVDAETIAAHWAEIAR